MFQGKRCREDTCDMLCNVCKSDYSSSAHPCIYISMCFAEKTDVEMITSFNIIIDTEENNNTIFRQWKYIYGAVIQTM